MSIILERITTMANKIIALLIIMVTAAIACTLFVINHHQQENSSQPLPQNVTLYRSDAAEIITLPYEEYIIGCIFGEVSPSCEDETLKAAACVINSRSLYSLNHDERINGADFADIRHPWIPAEQAMELYGKSYPSYLRKITEAAEFGMEHALFWQEEIISPPMCSISTGRTDDGGVEYLTAKELPSDKDNEEGMSTAAFSPNTVFRTLTKLTGICRLPAKPTEWFSNAGYTEGGTLTELHFGDMRVTGEQLREAFNLRSSAITVDFAEERFVFTVRGIGDNLGMSLNSAENQAVSGSTAEEILSFFYSPAELKNIS